MGRQTIDSMMPAPPTLPALLEHIGYPRQKNQGAWVLQLLGMLLAGGAHAASIAWPFAVGLPQGQPVWWLQLLALAGLVWQLDRCRTFRQGLTLGWVFATAWLSGIFWWLFISLHIYGGLASPLAVLAVLGLAIFLSTYYALASAVFVAVGPAGRTRRALVFAALWLMAELARVQLFTGFPWGEAGYAHVSGWLDDYARWIGVHGITFLAAFLAAGLAGWNQSRRQVLLFPLTALVIVAVAVLAGRQTSTSAGNLQVTLLQGNIPQNEKFQPGSGLPTALRWYAEQLQGAKTALVVAPETALPLLPQQMPEGYWGALQSRFATGGQAALIGTPLGSYSASYANSVVGLKPASGAGTAQSYRFDKHHLVPFGEFVPPGFRWFINLMNIPLGDFNRGPLGQPSFDWQGHRLAPNICYEDLFGEELAVAFSNAAMAPTILVNVSNIAWFGNSIAIDQHLAISRMRALEFERPMIRATNTGATVIIDHRGKVTHELPRHTRGALVGEVEGRTGITPYVSWVSRYGLWPFWGGAGVLVLLAWLARRRR
ncbi:MAG: apolipoprotein N-acyltransferase [Pseudomonadota bacterium]|uniref:apolipoprotein N-acyltransferase n=1 Tax=Polaromonas sp. TaxID=1869339 RepID=UPI0017EFA5A5|nr:apolipoprotein N-acyltransferase [Polaromonas sp.]MBA3592597.1 apolipoprotein N-acyltransferase [Polaromonas sp.]MDQ3272213.1 apolipoprotein N-acyltransferase [Pseudomonadota bacterium]